MKKTYHEGTPYAEGTDVRAEKGSRIGNAGVLEFVLYKLSAGA